MMKGLLMAELIADLFISLDGFAAGENAGAFFGYDGPELQERVRDVLSRPQLMVMGRVTYQALSAISMQATDEISSRMGDLPKAVVSNTLAEPLAWRNTRVVRAPVYEAANLRRFAHSEIGRIEDNRFG
jgi:dihydrofolate reductase